MTSTKCVIPGVHLKVFGRAIQSLSKIGDELYFEPLDEGLSLRTVNSSRSAYACFQFAPNFFITYITNGGTDKGNEEGIRCKLTMKSVMNVFRSLSNIDKTVERCKITFNLQEDKIVFQLCCRHGIVKTHNLSFMECETLQAIFSRDLCPSKLTANPKLLCDAVINFQANQEEVTLLLRPDFVALKNYVEDEPNPAKIIHTELTLSPDEFDHFQVGVDADVTFCLKEFRAILAFADLTNLPINLHIESPGRPITFSITSDLSFEANFVLATLAEPDDTTDHQQSQTATTKRGYHSNKSQNNTAKKQPSKHQHSRQLSHLHESSHRGEGETSGEEEADINDTTLLQSHSNGRPHTHRNHHTIKTTSNNKNNKNQRELFRNYESDAAETDNLDRNRPSTNSRTTVDRQESHSTASLNKSNGGFYVSASEDSQSQQGMERARGRESEGNTLMGDENGLDEDMSQIIPIRNEHSMVTTPSMISQPENEGEEERDDEDDQICGTPPSKRFRSLFFNTQSSTQSTLASQQKPAVLCPNSDSDDD